MADQVLAGRKWHNDRWRKRWADGERSLVRGPNLLWFKQSLPSSTVGGRDASAALDATGLREHPEVTIERHVGDLSPALVRETLWML